ncbi:hypothetical protein HK101_000842 [Irineochytrium annulatum]|nr:hypothetical protein HK101_000842 [Irineochytrium annulatum]
METQDPREVERLLPTTARAAAEPESNADASLAVDDLHKAGGEMAPCREATTGIYGMLTYSWMNPLMKLGWQRPLTMEDLPDLRDEDRAEKISARFAATTDRSRSLYLQLLIFERVPLLYMTLGEVASASLSLFSPYCLYLIIGYITDPAGRSTSYAFYVAAALGISIMIKALIENQVYQHARRMGLRLKAILVNDIFRKSLHRVASVESRQKAANEDGGKSDKKEDAEEEEEDESASVAKIVTLMSSDAEGVKITLPFLTDLVTYVFAIAVSIAGLFFVVGWSAFAGLFVMIATMPLTYVMASYTEKVIDMLMAATDKRTNVINEALQGIRVIKYFSWELNVLKKIDEARAREIRSLVRFYIQDGINTLLWVITPILVSFLTLLTVTKIEGKTLDAQMAFTCISLFNAIRMPLNLLPETIAEVFELNVIIKRIDKFLAQPELERFTAADYYRTQGPNDPIMGFRSAWFQWYTREAMNQADIPSPAAQPTATIGTKTMPDETRPLLSAPSIASTTDATTLAAPRERDSTTDGSTFTLRGIDLNFPVGGLTAVCGPTGAGKSSIMQALLGEMKRISGRAFLPDPRKAVATGLGDLTTGVAYVAQTSWLQNATIRDNICFGEAYDAIRYDRVIRACALVKDLETLEAGDLTEIGEKGINLSGGQKQRISLARAAYSRASFILLDDPLSAVDPPTARHLLTQCIIGLLSDRTRVLVTHATSLVLPHADWLVVIREGEILASGTVAEVVAASPAAAALVQVRAEDLAEDGAMKPVGSIPSMSELGLEEDLGTKDYANGHTPEDAKKLVENEGSQTGAISFAVYWSYISAAGGLLFLIPLLLSFAGDRAVLAYSDYWIKCWAEAYNATGDGNATKLDTLAVFSPLSLLSVGEGKPLITRVIGDESDGSKVDAMYYASIYALISLGWAATFLISFLVRSVGAYLASQKYHGQLMHSIFYAPLRFFDTTPIGRILNRASKDINLIDKGVMTSFATFLSCMNEALAVLVVVTLITPIFFLAILPIAAVYVFVAMRYLAVSRELKRLESTTRSPIYSIFSESLTGAATIRAYGAEARFMKENFRRLDTNHRPYYYLWSSNRWLGVRISLIAALIVGLSAVSTVAARDIIGAGLAGLSLTWASTLSDILILIVRNQAGMEMSVNAVERVNEYLEIDQEKPAVIEGARPPTDWPSRGAITVENLEMRYAPDQPPVLTDVNFSIVGGEKVGVVGRTGAGKSSLSLSLFRIVEPSAGRILIDGIDIANIGLSDLRSRLTIIPQDPVLFTGTIRSNLDPFNEHTDEALWVSIRKVRFLESLQGGSSSDLASPLGVDTDSDSEESAAAKKTRPPSSSAASRSAGFSLDNAVSEGGSNFSQGQRQLLCLARALLRSSNVTVFDEATASVDNETDARIQATIRGPEFRNVTVLSIAHRLRTIVDYDKILVLDKGRVIQFGSPVELIEAEGQFRMMCQESGEFDDLLGIARKDQKA